MLHTNFDVEGEIKFNKDLIDFLEIPYSINKHVVSTLTVPDYMTPPPRERSIEKLKNLSEPIIIGDEIVMGHNNYYACLVGQIDEINCIELESKYRLALKEIRDYLRGLKRQVYFEEDVPTYYDTEITSKLKDIMDSTKPIVVKRTDRKSMQKLLCRPLASSVTVDVDDYNKWLKTASYQDMCSDYQNRWLKPYVEESLRKYEFSKIDSLSNDDVLAYIHVRSLFATCKTREDIITCLSSMRSSFSIDDSNTRLRSRARSILKSLPDDELLRLADSHNLNTSCYRTSKVITKLKLSSNPWEWYPRARKIKRSFHIFTGPTNSGKTYQTIEALKKAKTGAYYAPLRLLAWEKYNELKEAGISVELLTGEEYVEVKHPSHVASTVMCANLHKWYNCVVIDEAQGIVDPVYGGFYSAAIFGSLARDIYITCTPESLPLITRMINDCGDKYTVHTCERKVPLVHTNANKEMKYDAFEKGDCIIAFSVPAIHAYAAALEDRGKKVSICYGALPYQVRQSEIDKFNNGETDVLVATDCIAMGMNINIKRVYIPSIEKHLGKNVVRLKESEINQIVGRAGRYGKFTVGEYCVADRTKLRDNESLERSKIYVNLPSQCLNNKYKMSDVFNIYSYIQLIGGYSTVDVSTQKKHYDMFKYDFDRMNIKEAYKFISITDAHEVTYEQCMRKYLTTKRVDVDVLEDTNVNVESYASLTNAAKVCDIFYQFASRIGDSPELIKSCIEARNKINTNLLELRKKKKYEFSTCSRCGCPMPYNSKYQYCSSCYSRVKSIRHFSYYRDDDDYWF